MKKLLATGSLALALALLAGCADMGGGDGAMEIKHPSPEMEMTRGACCLKPAK
jgi:hypothetical protein